MNDVIRKNLSIMTYIIAGKYNEKPFMAVDSIGIDISQETPKLIFIEKTRVFRNAEKPTYYSLAGQVDVLNLISLYDVYIGTKNLLFNHTSRKHIKKLIEFINYVKENYLLELEFTDTYLFFMTATGVCKYWLIPEVDKSKFKASPKLKRIDNNQMVNSWSNKRNRIIKDIDVKALCKSRILQVAKREEMDVKDRIAYMESDGENLKYTEPHKGFGDILTMVFQLDYEKMDEVEFKFEV